MKTIILKAIKQGFLKVWPGLTEGLTKNHKEKSVNMKMAQLNMRRQGLKSTRKKNKDKNLEDKCKTNLFFYTTVDPRKTEEGKFTPTYACGSQSTLTLISGFQSHWCSDLSFSCLLIF